MNVQQKYNELVELVKSLRHYQQRYRQYKAKADLASAQRIARDIDKHLKAYNQTQLL